MRQGMESHEGLDVFASAAHCHSVRAKLPHLANGAIPTGVALARRSIPFGPDAGEPPATITHPAAQIEGDRRLIDRLDRHNVIPQPAPVVPALPRLASAPVGVHWQARHSS